MQGGIYLAGGGTPAQEKPVLTAFLNGLASPDILYIPLALDPLGDYFKNAEGWINETLGSICPERRLNIHTMKNPTALPKGNFDGIFIGGGNTYRLMSALKESGLDQRIKRFLAEGRTVYGGSAGAIVCGAWIDIAQSERMGESDFKGMNFLEGLSCCCHYKEDDLSRIESHFERRASGIICLSETAGAVVEDGQLTSCGLSPVRVYTKGDFRPVSTSSLDSL